MNPGKLTKRIEIQTSSEFIDSNNVCKQEWVLKAKVWASMNNLYGKEYWSAKQYESENAVEFVIRYLSCKDLNIKDRIFYNGIYYNILSVDNVQYKNEIWKIKALAVM